MLALLGPLVITVIIGATLPRWASYVPASISTIVFVYWWLLAESRDGYASEAFLFYGAAYTTLLLLAAMAGRASRPDDTGEQSDELVTGGPM